MKKETGAKGEMEYLPAPWTLNGSGLILMLKAGSLRNANWGFEAGLAESLKTKIRLVMIVDYVHAPCGPYQELLLIPGTIDFNGNRQWSISDIWVSSQSSVENGRRNWGIPKQLAIFEKGDSEGITEEGIATRVVDEQGEVLLEIACQPMGPSLPFKSNWLPQSFLSMGQQLDGKRFFYTIAGSGRSRMAKVMSIKQSGGVFTGLHRSDVLAALRVEPFEMEFPVPEIKQLGAEGI